MKLVLFLTLLLTFNCLKLAFAVNKFPVFKTEKVQIKIPTNIMGIKDDPVNTSDDFIVYNINGQFFKNRTDGVLQTVKKGFNGKTNRSTPWEVLTEQLASYHMKKWDKLLSLYDKDSQKMMKEKTKKEDIPKILEQLNDKIKGMTVLLGYEFQNGHMAIWHEEASDTKNYSFFKKNNEKYVLSSIHVNVDDNNQIFWNLGLYLKYLPGPLSKPRLVRPILQMEEDETRRFMFKLNKKGNWLTLFKNKIDSRAPITVKDNGPREYNFVDLSKSDSLIEIDMKGWFFGKGMHTIYAIESNYPIGKITKQMIKKAFRFQVQVI